MTPTENAVGEVAPEAAAPDRSWVSIIVLLAAIAAVAVLLVAAFDDGGAGDESAGDPGGGSAETAAAEPGRAEDERVDPVSEEGATPAPTPLPDDYDGWVDPASVGLPYGQVEGVLTFRGSPTRSYYGQGPVPSAPVEAWRFPSAPEDDRVLCSISTVGPTTTQTTEWCGTGWTGQPAVFERDGRTWVVLGSLGSAVHFLDADTGERILDDFEVGDIIKGSVTIDPDGYPIVYFGSRDNFLRAVAFDRDVPTELWALDAESIEPRLYDNDWDGTPLVLDDHLFEGGENGQIHIVKLNRSYDADGLVQVDPELVFNAPGWDDELLADIGDQKVNIESSVMITGDTLYFVNSGGLLQGWDISGLAEGVEPERVFRFWVGDDADATVVADADGFLYLGVQVDRGTGRGAEVGQFMKLDPTASADPVVWSMSIRGELPRGIWATAALHEDVVYVPTNEGFVLGVDRMTGDVVWEKKLQGPIWSSPLVVDDVLIVADCEGLIHGYDVSDTRVDPPEMWSVRLDWCIESTPTVWRGRLFAGHRRGGFVAFSQP